MAGSRKPNSTICVSPETLRRARILSAQRSTSISALVTEEIDRLFGAEQA